MTLNTPISAWTRVLAGTVSSISGSIRGTNLVFWSFVEVERQLFCKSSDPVLIMSVNTCKEQTLESTWDRRSSQFPSVYSSHKTLLWYVSSSDLLNCDLPGSMPCPLNEHVHWNTGWGMASTIWINTSTEEFWLSPPFPRLSCDKRRSAKASGTTLNLRRLSAILWPLLTEGIGVYPLMGIMPN